MTPSSVTAREGPLSHTASLRWCAITTFLWRLKLPRYFW